jgi:acetaldehyde dehydrogenase (acetylating)
MVKVLRRGEWVFMASSVDAGCMDGTIRAQRLRGVTTTGKQ